MLNFIKKLFAGGTPIDFKSLVSAGAIIVDVRTPGEYRGSHIQGSVNIPLDQIKSKIAELKKKNKPVITCCRSGNRSSMAKGVLKSAGIECYNGGAWDSLKNKI